MSYWIRKLCFDRLIIETALRIVLVEQMNSTYGSVDHSAGASESRTGRMSKGCTMHTGRDTERRDDTGWIGREIDDG